MLKFGGELRVLQFNVRRLNQASGEFDFNCHRDQLERSRAAIRWPAALFGLVDQGVLNYGHFSGVRYKDYSFYAQDTYKMTSRLTC